MNTALFSHAAVGANIHAASRPVMAVLPEL
jgi:hypothetical protein